MISFALLAAHLLYVVAMPILLTGVINRTKAIWAGRKGPKLLQSAYDLRRLLRKRSVYSITTTFVFRAGAWVVISTVALCSLIAPVFPGFAPISFGYDFVALAYTLALGRVFLMLSALDTGSAFEGMGASREALFSLLAEPAYFLVLGALAMVTGHLALADVVGSIPRTGADWLVVGPTLIALLLLLQIEAARVPVDDPLTHLELTMIHEVMILDHSGPELAAVQYAAAMKLSLYAGLIAAFLNPVPATDTPVLSIAYSVLIAMGVAVLAGCVESVIARLRMRHVPLYATAAVAAGFFTLCAATWIRGLG